MIETLHATIIYTQVTKKTWKLAQRKNGRK